MGTLLRFLLIALPLAEILTFVLVVDQVGIGWSLLGLVAGVVVGAAVIRVVGAASLAELQGALLRREPPAGALFRGACVLIAGILLILPGFLSDVMALLLLISPLRTGLLGALWHRWPRGGPPPGGPTVIDGDYREVVPDRPRLDRDHPPHA